MKNKLRHMSKLILGILLICIVFGGFLYFNNDIGVSKSKLESDIRSLQKINDSWIVDGSASDTMAAYISYPQDGSDHTFSIYVNRPGLSFGYFFRNGGNASTVEEHIAEFTEEGYKEHAFISMNKEKVKYLELNDGNSIEKTYINSDKPFAIVLPKDSGDITFYDIDGNIVDWVEY